MMNNAYFFTLMRGDNPFLYEGLIYEDNSSWLRSLNMTLPHFCDIGVEHVKKGENPF